MGLRGRDLPIHTRCSPDLRLVLQQSDATQSSDPLMKQVHSFLWDFSIFNSSSFAPGRCSVLKLLL